VSTKHPASAGAAARKDFEVLLQKSDKMLAAILESASQAIVCVDRSGRIALANARTEQMFGYTRRELSGAILETLLPIGSREGHVKNREEYFEKPRVRPMGIGMELAGRKKDGTEFPVEISLSYIETGDGTFAIAFVTDISARKKLEEQLLHSQKMEAVGRLAGGVAHDFNNMLTIISGYNRMLLNQLSPMDPLRGYAEEVLKAADRAGALTNQLLAFSRRQVMQPRVLSVNALISGAEKMLRRLIGEDVELVIRPDAKAGNLRADAGQIEQVIFNLAVNARDAMPDGGRITIETAYTQLDKQYAKTHLGVQPGEYVLIAVSDTGHGMDAETKSHIFEPFFTTKEQGKGTGLGLATVYGIVKQSGGDIWVYSEPGKGTTFKVYFPRVDEPESKPARPGASLRRNRGVETILVVEDEQGVRELIGEMLKQQGYEVLKAADGLEAIRISERHQDAIHMLLTDVVMPQMSGKQLADHLLVSRPTMKVLYLSGYTENTVFHHGVLDPGFEFLGKPFSQEALAKKVREVLGPAAAGES
jgi:two-component system cell cycle sensor histidine kinase/response regulator CckA